MLHVALIIANQHFLMKNLFVRISSQLYVLSWNYTIRLAQKTTNFSQDVSSDGFRNAFAYITSEPILSLNPINRHWKRLLVAVHHWIKQLQIFYNVN